MCIKCVNHAIEILVGLGERRTLRGNIAVVKAVKRDRGLFQKLKKHRYTVQRVLQRIGTIIPGHQGCGSTEWV